MVMERPPDEKHAAAVKNGGGSVDIEATAISANLLPVKLPRSTCSIPAESLLRLLGRNARSQDPWVPVGTMGPLLIMAHHKPGSRDYWGVPRVLVIRVIIDPAQYEAILKDLHARIGYKPLEDTNPLETLAPPPGNEVKTVFKWFVGELPHDRGRAGKDDPALRGERKEAARESG